MAGRLSFFSDIVTSLFERSSFRAHAPSDQPIEALARDLLSGRGEVSGKKRATEILARYRDLSPEGKLAIFRFAAREMSVDLGVLRKALDRYANAPDAKGYSALVAAAEPARQELLRRLNQAPGATLELVRMRLDLLNLLPENPDLAEVDVDFLHLFRSWFNPGFLVLRSIDWHTPAHILEKIIEYEAVHAINDWHDLQRRVQPADRRCFAFFHPAMLEEPLIFVEVALCKGIPGSVQGLLGQDRDAGDITDVDTAVFYSISNCQEGLRGVSFGNSLIKQVVEELRQSLPQLTTFVTLSPIPGFTAHLARRAGDDPHAKALLAAAEAQDLTRLTALAEPARAYAAEYLLHAKRGKGDPADPVARFHLGNGAQVHQLHALADISPNGLRRSAGVMVNYLYDLDKIEANHEAYAGQNRVASSKALTTLAGANLPTGKTQ